MKIAVTYESGNVFQHFGHTEQFKLYQVEGKQIIGSQVVDTNGQGHGALAGFLQAQGVQVLICGGIGGGARQALAQAGIAVYAGAAGSTDAAVEQLLQGTLPQNGDVTCNHHHEEGEGHDCGSHGTSHSCGGHCHG